MQKLAVQGSPTSDLLIGLVSFLLFYCLFLQGQHTIKSNCTRAANLYLLSLLKEQMTDSKLHSPLFLTNVQKLCFQYNLGM